jgi:hypothetical protein
MRSTSLLALVALLFGLAFTLVSRDPQIDPRLKKAARLQERGGWIQVHLEGTPAEIGFQHGYLLAPEIADNFKAISTEMVHEEKKDWEFFRKTAQTVLWPHVEQEYRDELNGIVEGQAGTAVLRQGVQQGASRLPDRRRTGRPLQRLRRHRQLHQGRTHRHRTQQLDKLFVRRAMEHHLRHHTVEGQPDSDGRLRRSDPQR